MTPGAETACAFQPLAGFRILDCGTYMAGPLSAQILGDLGATVTKVVGPRGDPFMQFGYKRDGIGASWLTVNHGKEIVELDLKTPQGRERFLELVDGSDALVRNWRRDVCERLGLEGAALQARNARLAVIEIAGFKRSDREWNTPTFDSIVQAKSGLTSLARTVGATAGLPVNLVDKCTGLYAAHMLTAALLARAGTGKAPPPVTVSMVDVACHFNFPDTYQHLVHTDRQRDWLPPANILVACRDGAIVLSPPNRHELRKVAQAIGAADLAARLDDADGFNPADFLTTCAETIRAGLARCSVAEALALLARHDISAGPVLDSRAFLEWDASRPEPAARRVRHPLGWEYLTPAFPAHYE